MSQWVRLWDDMPTDPKWRVVARRSGRPLSEVLAVFVFMMTNAGANATERGRLLNWSDEDVGAALDIDAEHVEAIRSAMQGKTLDGDCLSGWERRQPKREDNSAERSRAWREGQKRIRSEERGSERARTQPNAEKRPEQMQSRADAELQPSESSNELSSGSSTALPLDLPPQPEVLDLRKARERKAESDLDLLDKVTDLWNAWAKRWGSPTVERLTDRRATHCRRRITDLKAYGHDSPEAAFEFLLSKCSASFYARGSPRKPLEFDQLMREDFMTRMLEGAFEYREARRV